jgi:hypothetical protein
MKSTVTRNTIWLTSGDYPYVDLEIKGVETFTNFSKSLVFYTPTHKTAIWFDKTTKEAKEDGMDLAVRPYSWWLVLDGINEIRCDYAGSHSSAAVQWFNGHEGSSQTLIVSEAEAMDIFKAVKSMVSQAVKDAAGIHKVEPSFGTFEKGPKGILKPAGIIVKYRVQGLVYNHNGPTAPKVYPHIPSFVPSS